MTNNDSRILQLKEQISAKREKIGKVKKFSPATSCSIELDGERYNLHALDKPGLVLLLCKLMSLNNIAESCGIADDLVFSGYKAADWIADINQKLDVAAQKDDLQSLNQLERKLDGMLSDDKKAEIELDAIAELLK